MVQQAATVSLMVLFLVPQLRNAYGTAAIGIHLWTLLGS